MRIHIRHGAIAAGMLIVASGAVATHAADEVSAAQSVETSAVVNPSFEEVTSDGELVGWTPRTPRSPEVYSLSQERASDGQNSIHMHDDDPELGGSLISDPIPAESGREYEFVFEQYLVSGALAPFMYFEDADGQRIDHVYERVETTSGQWEQASLVGRVPDEATQIRLLVNASVGGVVDSYVDNVSLRMLPLKGIEEDLGTYTGHVAAQTTGVTTDASGRTLALLGSNGQPVRFSAVDVSTGERLMQQEMPGASMTWSYASADDGTTYIGTSQGGMWRFDPDALALEQIQDNPLGESHLYSMDMHEDGRVFIGTYPGGKVLSYDPDADEWTDHGGFGNDAAYSKTVDVAGDTVYVGTQAPIGLWSLDLATGDKTQIAIPDQFLSDGGFQSVDVFGDTLVALTFTPSRTLLVYDMVVGEWTHQVDDVAYRRMAEPRWVTTPDGERYEVYYQDRASREVRGLDLNTGETRTVGFSMELNSMNWYWAPVEREGFPGDSLVGTTQGGMVTAWNPESGEAYEGTGDFAPSPAFVRSLNAGPDGNIYFGGFASHGLIRYAPDTDEATKLPGPGQMEQLGSNGDDLVIGGYGYGAPVTDFDTTQAWEWEKNPAPRVHLGDEQERVAAIEAVAPTLTALGSYPVKGAVGGALAFYDHEQRTTQTYRNIVQDQTVMSLAYRDGMLYGGTSIVTGLGTEPTTSEGHLFVYDVAAREKEFVTVPVPGDQHVARLAFDDEGMLWGMTGTTLFSFDPQTRQVVDLIEFERRNDRDTYVVGRGFEWVEDRFVGYSRCELFEFDPSTKKVSTLVEKTTTTCNGLGIDEQGRYYYGAGTHVFRWTPMEKIEPACTETFTDAVNDGLVVPADTVACLDGASVDGAVQVQPGGALRMEPGSSIHGSLTASEAAHVKVRGTEIRGAVSVTGTNGQFVFAGNDVRGSLDCSGNASEPDDEGAANTVTGSVGGQCAGV
ncbi:outer membrane protein assembly factor BamB family protein [Microbacterium sp. JB110]|uniref:outer membrane protein assembly factor BamB family protein n=1 Tax=Microbacterium sp. JB110 TaxID=2024477 RepID=UPI00097F304F|nr:PQQ-binding-like beta-propeller repeat protein [Microbacterium sp. JB110]RCS60070.1 hypothetical protein CIK77_11740 [Microbacterium sp. JB110]SJM45265.1 secreted protein [Frigoribacterium sp. JB110]